MRNNLFASCLSAQLPKYVSWRLDPEALHADAPTMNWEPFKGYAFPPFNLILAVLNKVAQDKGDIILVAPLWQAKPWWPLLLSLLVEQPVLTPTTRHLSQDPSDPQRTHPIGAVTLDLLPMGNLRVTAWVGFTLGYDRLPICGYTLVNYPRGR